MAQTQKANLISVEVFSKSVSEKLGNAIKLMPLAYVENVNGQAGSVKVPKYSYIGDAGVIAEGVAIDPSLLTQDADTVDIIKVKKAINMTKEAMKSGYGDPLGKAEEQIIKAVANGIENQMFVALRTATLAHTTAAGAGVSGAEVLKAITLFGEDADGEKVLLVNPNQMEKILTDGAYDKENKQLFGCDVVFSNRVAAGEAFIVKPGAIGLYLDGEVEVESDKDVLASASVVTAEQFFGTHLRDESLAVKITLA